MATKRSILIGRIVSTVCLTLLALVWVIPIIWALGASFKPDLYTDADRLFPLPENFTWANYSYLLFNGDYPVLRWILNSFIVASISTVLYLIVVSFAAYALVFVDFRFKNLIFNLVLASMMVPGIVTFIPMYNLMDSFGWAGAADWTYFLSLIFPGLGGVFGLFLIRSFFLNIPKELVESCKVDGCNNFQIFFRVILPIGKSAIFVAAIFAFLGNWNDFMWPQQMSIGVQMFSPELLTLPVGLAKLSGSKTGDVAPLAGAVLSAIPVMLVYIFSQKYIIDGVSRSGIK
ncbi:MAG: carbohydrate ABC transporter permease [Bacilli bacterium]|nr:carbohydrate ABC transporter permease [Bacilli bacterium]